MGTALRIAAIAIAGTLAAAAAPRTILMDGTRFAPDPITIKRGETVTFVNKDPFPHTATAKVLFDSGSIGEGKSWMYRADKPGRFDYVCTLHPGMKGTLIVQ